MASTNGESRERAHHHPVFARGYALLANLAERGELARIRSQVLARAHGRLLVLGAGQGHDLAHLPAGVSEVLAVEPDPAMRRLGKGRLALAPVPAYYLSAVAEQLPLPDSSIDAALAALVLCSVRDPARAASELRRVLRPNGVLLVLEHVRAEPGSLTGWLQERVDPAWRHLSGGCHLSRPTRAVLEQAGFDTSQVVDRHLAKLMPLIDRALQGPAYPRAPT